MTTPSSKWSRARTMSARWKPRRTPAFSAIYIVFAMLAFPSLIAMLNTLTIGVLERTREIGMMRAVGATRKQIRNMVVVEALLLAAIGTAFGILGGLYLGYVFVIGIEVIFPMGYFFPAERHPGGHCHRPAVRRAGGGHSRQAGGAEWMWWRR